MAEQRNQHKQQKDDDSIIDIDQIKLEGSILDKAKEDAAKAQEDAAQKEQDRQERNEAMEMLGI